MTDPACEWQIPCGFPAPLTLLAGTRVYDWERVQRWAIAEGRLAADHQIEGVPTPSGVVGRWVTRSDVGRLLGITSERVHQSRRDPDVDFPEPLGVLALGEVFDWDAVRDWARAYGRSAPDDPPPIPLSGRRRGSPRGVPRPFTAAC